MKVEQIKKLLDQTGGKFFTATFVKRDGTIRRMNCRAGVTRHCNGGKSTMRDKPEYYTVYDCKVRGYRNINLTTLRTLRMRGSTIVFGAAEYLEDNDISNKVIEDYAS